MLLKFVSSAYKLYCQMLINHLDHQYYIFFKPYTDILYRLRSYMSFSLPMPSLKTLTFCHASVSKIHFSSRNRFYERKKKIKKIKLNTPRKVISIGNASIHMLLLKCITQQ